ncbi:hypothetical protein B0T20DRAFT_495064 [Sordaria brevicollis]|uniref:J domain-containing protein n=1 Tax=Sordaria brevicollis TaxID=83679 RepID=A0AAE0UE59_SORBR|nr:hypothetical protein B0T20DRAFT_495064 [Sordaria brevicollis]
MPESFDLAAIMTSPGDRMFDCYATLGVSPYDDTETIGQAYRSMVWQHDHLNDKSEKATAKFQKVEKAFRTLGSSFNRTIYDTEVMQEYLDMYNQIIKLCREWDTKPQEAVKADIKVVRAKHETMVRLTKSMADLVRELKFHPRGKGAHAACRVQALRMETKAELWDEKVNSMSYIETNESLRTKLAAERHQNLAMKGLLERERKKTRDAEEHNARLTESLRNAVAQMAVDDGSLNPTAQDVNNEAPTKSMENQNRKEKSEPSRPLLIMSAVAADDAAVLHLMRDLAGKGDESSAHDFGCTTGANRMLVRGKVNNVW